MPLLTELGGWEMDFCYEHVAPNGASALKRRLFNRATQVYLPIILPVSRSVAAREIFSHPRFVKRAGPGALRENSHPAKVRCQLAR